MTTIALQTIFTTIIEHLRKQNAQCRAPNPWKTATYHAETVCGYRGENGMKCAVGVLITDEAYTPQCEGVGIMHLHDIDLSNSDAERERARALKAALAASNIDIKDYQTIALLEACQDIHDDYMTHGFKDRAQHRARAVAAEFGLIYPE